MCNSNSGGQWYSGTTVCSLTLLALTGCGDGGDNLFLDGSPTGSQKYSISVNGDEWLQGLPFRPANQSHTLQMRVLKNDGSAFPNGAVTLYLEGPEGWNGGFTGVSPMSTTYRQSTQVTTDATGVLSTQVRSTQSGDLTLTGYDADSVKMFTYNFAFAVDDHSKLELLLDKAPDVKQGLMANGAMGYQYQFTLQDEFGNGYPEQTLGVRITSGDGSYTVSPTEENGHAQVAIFSRDPSAPVTFEVYFTPTDPTSSQRLALIDARALSVQFSSNDAYKESLIDDVVSESFDEHPHLGAGDIIGENLGEVIDPILDNIKDVFKDDNGNTTIVYETDEGNEGSITLEKTDRDEINLQDILDKLRDNIDDLVEMPYLTDPDTKVSQIVVTDTASDGSSTSYTETVISSPDPANPGSTINVVISEKDITNESGERIGDAISITGLDKDGDRVTISDGTYAEMPSHIVEQYPTLDGIEGEVTISSDRNHNKGTESITVTTPDGNTVTVDKSDVSTDIKDVIDAVDGLNQDRIQIPTVDTDIIQVITVIDPDKDGNTTKYTDTIISAPGWEDTLIRETEVSNGGTLISEGTSITGVDSEGKSVTLDETHYPSIPDHLVDQHPILEGIDGTVDATSETHHDTGISEGNLVITKPDGSTIEIETTNDPSKVKISDDVNQNVSLPDISHPDVDVSQTVTVIDPDSKGNTTTITDTVISTPDPANPGESFDTRIKEVEETDSAGNVINKTTEISGEDKDGQAVNIVIEEINDPDSDSVKNAVDALRTDIDTLIKMPDLTHPDAKVSQVITTSTDNDGNVTTVTETHISSPDPVNTGETIDVVIRETDIVDKDGKSIGEAVEITGEGTSGDSVTILDGTYHKVPDHLVDAYPDLGSISGEVTIASETNNDSKAEKVTISTTDGKTVTVNKTTDATDSAVTDAVTLGNTVSKGKVVIPSPASPNSVAHVVITETDSDGKTKVITETTITALIDPTDPSLGTKETVIRDVEVKDRNGKTLDKTVSVEGENSAGEASRVEQITPDPSSIRFSDAVKGEIEIPSDLSDANITLSQEVSITVDSAGNTTKITETTITAPIDPSDLTLGTKDIVITETEVTDRRNNLMTEITEVTGLNSHGESMTVREDAYAAVPAHLISEHPQIDGINGKVAGTSVSNHDKGTSEGTITIHKDDGETLTIKTTTNPADITVDGSVGGGKVEIPTTGSPNTVKEAVITDIRTDGTTSVTTETVISVPVDPTDLSLGYYDTKITETVVTDSSTGATVETLTKVEGYNSAGESVTTEDNYHVNTTLSFKDGEDFGLADGKVTGEVTESKVTNHDTGEATEHSVIKQADGSTITVDSKTRDNVDKSAPLSTVVGGLTGDTKITTFTESNSAGELVNELIILTGDNEQGEAVEGKTTYKANDTLTVDNKEVRGAVSTSELTVTTAGGTMTDTLETVRPAGGGDLVVAPPTTKVVISSSDPNTNGEEVTHNVPVNGIARKATVNALAQIFERDYGIDFEGWDINKRVVPYIMRDVMNYDDMLSDYSPMELKSFMHNYPISSTNGFITILSLAGEHKTFVMTGNEKDGTKKELVFESRPVEWQFNENIAGDSYDQTGLEVLLTLEDGRTYIIRKGEIYDFTQMRDTYDTPNRYNIEVAGLGLSEGGPYWDKDSGGLPYLKSVVSMAFAAENSPYKIYRNLGIFLLQPYGDTKRAFCIETKPADGSLGACRVINRHNAGHPDIQGGDIATSANWIDLFTRSGSEETDFVGVTVEGEYSNKAFLVNDQGTYYLNSAHNWATGKGVFMNKEAKPAASSSGDLSIPDRAAVESLLARWNSTYTAKYEYDDIVEFGQVQWSFRFNDGSLALFDTLISNDPDGSLADPVDNFKDFVGKPMLATIGAPVFIPGLNAIDVIKFENGLYWSHFKPEGEAGGGSGNAFYRWALDSNFTFPIFKSITYLREFAIADDDDRTVNKSEIVKVTNWADGQTPGGYPLWGTGPITLNDPNNGYRNVNVYGLHLNPDYNFGSIYRNNRIADYYLAFHAKRNSEGYYDFNIFSHTDGDSLRLTCNSDYANGLNYSGSNCTRSNWDNLTFFDAGVGTAKGKSRFYDDADEDKFVVDNVISVTSHLNYWVTALAFYHYDKAKTEFATQVITTTDSNYTSDCLSYALGDTSASCTNVVNF